eukprot:gene6096-7061_t
MNKSIILFALVATLALVQAQSYSLDYKKVQLVDHIPLANGNTNFLFRGNEPRITVNGQPTFAYQELVEYMVNRSTEAGVTMPDKFQIIDIKLIYGLKEEYADVYLEEYFFGNNTELGMFGINITLGDITDPNIVPATERMEMAKLLSSWQKDNLPARIASYRQILETEFDMPIALYIHCECGCDRTGEIFASYVMRYMGWSFNDSINWDDKIAGRIIMPNHQWAAQWYCLYMQVENIVPGIDCTRS